MKRILFSILFFFLSSNAYAETSCLKKLKVLVIDAYSTGSKLAPYLTGRDVEVHHMHSALKPPKEFAPSFKSDTFKSDHAPATYEEALAIARELGIDKVMVGTETGVVWDAKLNADLGFAPHETEETLAARRDKYLMTERVRERGLRAVKQNATLDVESAIFWINHNKLFEKGPKMVVLKPPMSAGADSVYFCKTEAEVREAFQKIMESKNLFELKNEFILVQEYLVGTEYVVNTASRESHHKVSDMWEYTKIHNDDGRRLYGTDKLIAPRGEIQDQLVAYAKDVLNALEIKTGWGHIEIMMTEDGPVLVEIGNRMMGSNLPLLVTKALGAGQIEYGVAAHLYPEEFKNLPDLYKLRKGAAVVTINCYQDGMILNPEIITEMQKLPAYSGHNITPTKHEIVNRTVDLLSSPGHIDLVHKDPAVLSESIRILEQWVAEGRFFIKP